MKDLNNAEQQALLSPDRLLKDVYSIIDSRIQYIEYQAHCRLKNCIRLSSLRPKPGVSNSQPIHRNSDHLANNFDQMLSYVDSLTTPLKLLQILKSWLREDNISLIMTLLYNNTYLEYSEEHLEQILKKEAVQHLA